MTHSCSGLVGGNPGHSSLQSSDNHMALVIKICICLTKQIVRCHYLLLIFECLQARLVPVYNRGSHTITRQHIDITLLVCFTLDPLTRSGRTGDHELAI